MECFLFRNKSKYLMTLRPLSVSLVPSVKTQRVTYYRGVIYIDEKRHVTINQIYI